MSRVFDFDRAIVRAPGRSAINGLREGDGDAPSYEGVAAEHAAYVAALEDAGLSVEVLPPLEDFPDSIFVEDPALVIPEAAILLRPGAPTRLGEAALLGPAFAGYFGEVPRLAVGCADGGDILITPTEILIGLSARTDATGARALAEMLESLGRVARIVETPPAVLHFKTACALLDEETVFATPALARSHVFGDVGVLETPAGEEAAANLLRVNDRILVGASYPRTIDLLASRGHSLVPLRVAEIARLDAGLSCMSLRWRSAAQ